MITLLVIAAIGGAAAGLWALRPSPTFSSGDLATGSSFDVTFRVENTDPRLTLFNLKISCILAQVRALPIEPTMVEGDLNVRFSGKEANNLAPGESGTFTCPFRGALSELTNDDPGIAQRAKESTFAANTICR